MAELSFYINNQLAPPPDNFGELELENDFTNNSNDATIRSTTLEWKGENATKLNAWLNGGLINSYGIFEGIPFRIEACDPAVVVFDGCIDMTSENTTFTCDIVKADIKETQRVYFMQETAAGFTFAYLADPSSSQTAFNHLTFNPIAVSDYIPVPYVISNCPDYFEVATMAVSILELTGFIGNNSSFGQIWQTVNKLWQDIVECLASIADFFSAILAVIEAVGYAIELALYIAYTVYMVTLTVNLILSMFQNLISVVKDKYGMFARDLFTKACDYLGLSFSSTIVNNPASIYYNSVVIPKKQSYINNATWTDNPLSAMLFSTFNRKDYDDSNNTNSYGYYEGSFQQFIIDMEAVFNAKISIRNGTLYFERWDYWNSQAAHTLPPQSSEAPFEDPYGTNASELSSNYSVKWQLDTTDNNTYDKYEGTSCQMQLVPYIISNQRNVLLKGLNEIQLPFALAKRKNDLTIPEQVLQDILNFLQPAINAIIDIINVAASIVKIIATISLDAIVTVLNGLIDIVNGVIYLTGGSTIPQINIGAINTAISIIIPTLDPLPTNLFNDRIGMMLLSTDFTGVQKFLIVDSNHKLDVNNTAYNYDNNKKRLSTVSLNMGYTDAYRIQLDFHAASWAVDTFPFVAPDGSIINPISYPNQYLTFKDKEIPLCCSDYKTILNNNIVKTIDAKFGRVDSLKWNPHKEMAKIDYRIKEVYTRNLNQILIVDGN